jgi:hypothetical protein
VPRSVSCLSRLCALKIVKFVQTENKKGNS